MDFIIGLPVVDGKGSIFSVVDYFLKYRILLAAPAHCLAEEAAAIFLFGVVKHFGLPFDIVTRFTGHFWTSLLWKMGTWLKFLTANHS